MIEGPEQSLFIPGISHLVLATHARQVGMRILQFLEEIQEYGS